jgi:protein-L-isoaspartate(D-aspartate) O-methyltransferase
MEDTFKHKGLRKKLVEEIRKKGITDEAVLKAIGTIPRHWFFMAKGIEDYAYVDKAFPISAGQTISQPYTVAFQSQILNVKKGEKILEIGTGSGYQAAVLVELGAKVYTIERQKDLYIQTSKLLPSLGFHLQTFLGDGYKGLPNYGPFDKIIITAAPPEIPQALLGQLKIGGKLIAPVGETDVQIMREVVRKSELEFEIIDHGTFSFVPMLKGIGENK